MPQAPRFWGPAPWGKMKYYFFKLVTSKSKGLCLQTMSVWTKSSFWLAHSLLTIIKYRYHFVVSCMTGLLGYSSICLSSYHTLLLFYTSVTSVQPCASRFKFLIGLHTWNELINNLWIGAYSEIWILYNLKAVFHIMLKSLILRICLSTMVTNVTGEWPFWKLKRIKNCYWSTMTEESFILFWWMLNMNF